MFIRHAIGGDTLGVTYDAEGGGGGAGGGAGSGGGVPGGGTGGDPTAGSWYAGKVDQETVGHWQNRGWDVTNPVTVATAATKAWRDAEAAAQALHGVPADRLLRLPQPGDEAATKAFHQKLGAPIDATGYDFSAVKRSTGEAADPNMTGAMAQTFLKLGISKDAATEIARSMVSFDESKAAAALATTTAKVQAEQAALRTNWGANYQMNHLVAQQAAAKLGITAAELDLMDGQIGHARVMDMFRQIGSQMGEAPFHSAGPGGSPMAMTQEQAVARMADLKRDPEWVKKYLGGDTAARNEMAALSRMKLGEIDESARPARFAR